MCNQEYVNGIPILLVELLSFPIYISPIKTKNVSHRHNLPM